MYIYIYNIIPECVYSATSLGRSQTTHFLKLDLTFNGVHHQQTLIT